MEKKKTKNFSVRAKAVRVASSSQLGLISDPQVNFASPEKGSVIIYDQA